MKRVSLRVESLDDRTLPSASSVGIGHGGSKPGVINTSDPFGNKSTSIELLGGSKPGTGGTTLRQGADKGIELFGGSKPVTNGGSN